MNLAIQPETALLDGHDLLKLRRSGNFLVRFGSPSRHRDIPMHSGGTRIAMVWDQIGFVAYEDRPETLMSHFILAFDPEETPERPVTTGQHTIEINGGIVTGGTSEKTLPQKGPTPIATDIAKHFFYQTESYSIHFNFERHPNPRSREVIIKHLISVSFTWRNS